MIQDSKDNISDGNWPAPTVNFSSGARAQVEVPASKSLTNRYLLLAAIADSVSLIHNPLHSRDSALMISALEALGARFEEVAGDSAFGPDLRVFPIDFNQNPINKQINVGLAGTVMRFVPPLAGLVAGSISFDGDPQARKRPMNTIIEALRALGIAVDDGGQGALPFTLVSPGTIETAELEIDASSSSQFVSALLLSAVRFKNGLRLRHVGSPIPSMPHVEMTINLMRQVGIKVSEPEQNLWQVEPGSFSGFEVTVEPDLSNAGPFLCAALALGTSVSVKNWPEKTSQGGNHWLDILPRFGASVKLEQGVLTVTGPDGGARAGLPGLDVNLAEAGELAPTVAALCALAEGESQLRGIAHLRGHETDRLAALTNEINRLGGEAEETADGIRFLSPIKQGGLMRTYADHRMATAAAIMGLVQPDIIVENVATTAKTLPNFTGLWESMLADFAKGEHNVD